MTAKEAYLATAQLACSTETGSWERFNSFLLGNSMIVLSWCAIFVSGRATQAAAMLVMSLLCLLGILSGVAWMGLSIRGRAHHDIYMETGKLIESNAHLPAPQKIFTIARQKTESLQYPWAGSRWVQLITPVALVLLYLILLFVVPLLS